MVPRRRRIVVRQRLPQPQVRTGTRIQRTVILIVGILLITGALVVAAIL